MSKEIELMYEVADKDKVDPMNSEKDMVTLTVEELEAFYSSARAEAYAAGQAEMRERAAVRAETQLGFDSTMRRGLLAAIRALPIAGEGEKE